MHVAHVPFSLQLNMEQQFEIAKNANEKLNGTEENNDNAESNVNSYENGYNKDIGNANNIFSTIDNSNSNNLLSVV